MHFLLISDTDIYISVITEANFFSYLLRTIKEKSYRTRSEKELNTILFDFKGFSFDFEIYGNFSY